MAKTKGKATKPSKPDSKPIDLMEKLKQFVRTKGPEYLRDKNITSIGIGYKIKGGKPTDEISIQFTVGKKAAVGLLESLETEEIPRSINVEGTEVPTDVIQRNYTLSYKIVAEGTAVRRKTRINPIVPGVSVGHTDISAGTIGCIVFDKNNGTPYILSNWHVLNSNFGIVGDTVVQPGPHDDNRIAQNHLGKLVRSHLGHAGDCAVATIEDRSFDPQILGLNVAPASIGEPELGDIVIKSGRTTAVTYGKVMRVDTLVLIDYGDPLGEQEIGCFEIGIDNRHRPANGEISKGGDSGALWMFYGNGRSTDVAAGLHFAGEDPNSPLEFALACYPKSVFEKLEISLTQPQQVAPASPDIGYNPDFLGEKVNLPAMKPESANDPYKLDGSPVIPYVHFSLALSKSRKFAHWVAWNIDGGRLKSLSRNGLSFKLDNRIPSQFQAGEEVYRSNRLDRGHIARRADLLWGSTTEAKQANTDSFYFPNIAPQMDNFNQSGMGGIWGKLEDAVFSEVSVDDLKVSVFGGPVFRDDDRSYRGVKIPREFFKAIFYREAGKLKVKAFLLTQNLNQLEMLDLEEFKVYQVGLVELEQRCQFNFPPELKEVDVFLERMAIRPEAVAERSPLTKLEDIVW